MNQSVREYQPRGHLAVKVNQNGIPEPIEGHTIEDIITSNTRMDTEHISCLEIIEVDNNRELCIFGSTNPQYTINDFELLSTTATGELFAIMTIVNNDAVISMSLAEFYSIYREHMDDEEYIGDEDSESSDNEVNEYDINDPFIAPEDENGLVVVLNPEIINGENNNNDDDSDIEMA